MYKQKEYFRGGVAMMQLTIVKGMQGSGKTKFIEYIVGANKIADTGYACIY